MTGTPRVTEIGQLSGVPIPGSSDVYLTLSVRQQGRSDWNVLSATWNGACTITPNTDVDGLNSPGDEFQCSVSRDRRFIVLDTPPSHPIGGGRPMLGPTGRARRQAEPHLFKSCSVASNALWPVEPCPSTGW